MCFEVLLEPVWCACVCVCSSDASAAVEAIAIGQARPLVRQEGQIATGMGPEALSVAMDTLTGWKGPSGIGWGIFYKRVLGPQMRNERVVDIL